MTATDERGPKAQHDDVGQSWPGDGAMGWEVDDAGSEGRPRRVQLRRTSGWRKPAGAVVVARPTKWSNPVVVGSQASLSGIDADGLQYSYQVIVTPQIAVDAFRDLMSTRLTVLDPDEPEDATYVQGWRDALALLRGHDLACWCPLRDPLGNPVPCHADVLLELARPAPPPTPRPVQTPVPPLDPPPVLTCRPLKNGPLMTTLATPAVSTTFELRSGPHTIAGPGESCLVCGDPLSVGEVYLFVAWDGEAGVAHEDCAEFEAAADADAAAVPGGDPAAALTAAGATAREGRAL